jgi:hypothetical protein
MDATTLEAGLRDAFEIELSRLGSSKALYALTGGEMDDDAVRAAAGREADAAAETFGAWAAAERDAGAAALFERAATAGEERRDAVPDDGETPPPYRALDGLADTPERLGGFLARTLVVGAVVGQMVGFFVGAADPRAADEFRDVRDALDDQREAALAALDDACTDETDWTRAEESATAALDAAYDQYVERLEALGVKPKNVC